MSPAPRDARQMIADCDAKMVRYRAAIDAGGDLEEITGWINEAKSERRLAEAALRAAPSAPHRLTREEIKAIVDRFASLAAVVRNADPADKAEIYQGLNLVLTYQPEARTVRAEAQLSTDSRGAKVGVRGGLEHANAGDFPGSGKSYRQASGFTRPLHPMPTAPAN